MPDPGEPHGGAVALPLAAGRVPGWPGGPATVHLLIRVADRWSTRCPADVEGIGPGADPRRVVTVLEPVGCPWCWQADPEGCAQVTAAAAVCRAVGDQQEQTVLRFLRWLREDQGIVLADYAGGVTLKAYPSSSDAGLVAKWQADRAGE